MDGGLVELFSWIIGLVNSDIELDLNVFSMYAFRTMWSLQKFHSNNARKKQLPSPVSFHECALFHRFRCSKWYSYQFSVTATTSLFISNCL